MSDRARRSCRSASTARTTLVFALESGRRRSAGELKPLSSVACSSTATDISRDCLRHADRRRSSLREGLAELGLTRVPNLGKLLVDRTRLESPFVGEWKQSGRRFWVRPDVHLEIRALPRRPVYHLSRSRPPQGLDHDHGVARTCRGAGARRATRERPREGTPPVTAVVARLIH